MDHPIDIPPRIHSFTRSPCFLLLAFSIFLHSAFCISHPPPLPDSDAPSLSPRDSVNLTISHGKGSGNLFNTSSSGISNPQPSGGNSPAFPLALLYFIPSLSVFPFLFRYLQYTRFRKVFVTPQVFVAVSWHQRCTQSPNFR